MRASSGQGVTASLRHQRGQTIVIALLVLLLLAFVGGLFATIVTRNLANAGRSNRVQSADYYAEAGIRFANNQLTASLDGADWRPQLQNQLDAPYQPKDPRALARYNATVTAQGLPTVAANDPDGDYLKQGFTRYNIGGGRYLLRVTYDPAGLNNQDKPDPTTNTAYSDPRGRYLKIESVGREGSIDSNDPTTYSNLSKTQLNATLVQYKAIGITDYARFETNPENRSDIMALGVSSTHDMSTGAGGGGILTPGVFDFTNGSTTPDQYPIVTTYGAPNAYLQQTSAVVPNPNPLVPNTDLAALTPPAGMQFVPGGGSMHTNGSVRFFGQNTIYLNNNANNVGAFGDTVEIAGNLLLDNYTVGSAANTELITGQDAAVVLNPPAASNPAATDYIAPSNGKFGFDTHGGKVRDGNGGNDVNGNPRSVNRLDPPTLDSVNPATNLPRYASITKNPPQRAMEDTANAVQSYYPSGAAYGYGQSIYVDNSSDVQSESSSLVGGYTLVDEWLHRAGAGNQSGSKAGWSANFYRPPGVDIVLGRQQVTLKQNTPTSFYGVRMTRSDVDGAGKLTAWKNPDGSDITGVNNSGVNDDGNTQSTMTVSYDSLNASNDLTAGAANQLNPNNDVIIYAEGNVRVHGVVSADVNDTASPTTYAGTTGSATDDDHLPRHVTIVTGGTAYIDGSLLRGNPESSITVLAHDYVCVNTTQFLAGTIVDQTPAGTRPPGPYTGDPSLRALDFSASDEVLLQEFTLTGPPATGTGTTTDEHLYISGGPSAPGATAVDFDVLNASTGYNLNSGNPVFTNPTQVAPTSTGTVPLPFFASIDSSGFNQPNFFMTQTGLLRTTFDLGDPSAAGITPSQPLQLAVRRDQGTDGTPSTQDFLLERAAILPMDIKIEAVLFAQTRSFFVIPGDWFNTSTDDNIQTYANNGNRPGIDVNNIDQNRFPFYGQPIDMKILIDGSVSEARPADIAAQSAWMAKWGWIPQYRGGLVTTANMETTNRPAFGNTNPLGVGLQIIYNPLAGFPYYTDHYLRTDIFGRPLPYAPKLPVCAGLLYAGQNTGESVLQ